MDGTQYIHHMKTSNIHLLTAEGFHYDDVIMDAIASQIASLASVYSDV